MKNVYLNSLISYFMKILYVIPSIDINTGGTATFLQLLSNTISKSEDVSIATIQSKNPVSLSEQIKLNYFPLSFPFLFNFSSGLKKFIQKYNFDIYHGNVLWLFPTHIMSRIARKKGRSYIISTHGMLEPWALNKGKFKKSLVMKLFQFNDLANSVCIHATARSEAKCIRELGFTNPIAIIPNGIDITEFKPKSQPNTRPKKTLLFLSRVHPKKGLEMLINAWSLVDERIKLNWKVEIAGNGNSSYLTKLNNLIHSLNLSDEINITGPKFGADKIKTYENADLFILPTYSENFGIVIAEALACGIPVITTKGTPWEDLQKEGIGWWTDIDVNSISDAITESLMLSDIDRFNMGIKGREFVKDNFSIDVISESMIDLYKWVDGKIEMPDFVDLS